jgi:hypothetical protein
VAQVWHSWGGVLVASALGLPVAVLAGWLLARSRPGRPVRYAVAEVLMVAGTLPWLWMILTPSRGTPRRVSLVPLRDLAALAPADLAVQIGGNLLVFAALGFLLPIRFDAVRFGAVRFGAVRFGARVPAVLAIAAAGSVTVETLQYLLDLGRVSSVDDVLVNTLGAGLAALCSRPWWRVREPGRPAAPVDTPPAAEATAFPATTPAAASPATTPAAAFPAAFPAAAFPAAFPAAEVPAAEAG